MTLWHTIRGYCWTCWQQRLTLSPRVWAARRGDFLAYERAQDQRDQEGWR